MKRFVMIALLTISMLSLWGCAKEKTSNNMDGGSIVPEEPKIEGEVFKIEGKVTEVHENYIMIYFETYGYPYGADCDIPLNSGEIYSPINVGDEIIVEYDGQMMETYPLQMGTVYSVSLKTPASEIPGGKNSIVEIRDLAKEEGLDCAEAEEKFYENADYEYYFNCVKSQHIIVTYDNGNSEDIVTALENGNAKLSDLNKYGIEYSFKVKNKIQTGE